ncbi:MAG: guanitoxin biosynthesis pre-guanitoxin forming N-methyltransferase GntF [bacterium]
MSEYDKSWSPEEYLERYYSTEHVASDELGILDFVRKFLAGRRFETMLDFGCGPTIHHMIPFVDHVGRIFGSDYIEGNLEKVRKWVFNSPDAHDWTAYLRGILRHESGEDPSASDIAERGRALRRKMGKLYHCNVLDKVPLGTKLKFDLVTSFYCVDCCTSSIEQWTGAMSNLASLVAPGGSVVLAALGDTDHYKVGDNVFSTTRINEGGMHDCLIAVGFKPETVRVEVKPCPEWADEGFDSIIVASAQK